MADKARGPLNQVIGNAGKDPEEHTTKIGPVVRFSVARTMGYGDDAPPPRWVSVAVFNEDLRDQAMERIQKGTPVAVEGTITEDTYNGKPQYNMVAARLGVIDWFLRSKTTPPPTRKAAEPVDGGEW